MTTQKYTYTLYLTSNAQLELSEEQAVRLCAYEYLNKDYAFTHAYEEGAKLLSRRRELLLSDNSVLRKTNKK